MDCSDTSASEIKKEKFNIKGTRANAVRNYNQGSHPCVNETWIDLQLFEYRYDSVSKTISFKAV